MKSRNQKITKDTLTTSLQRQQHSKKVTDRPTHHIFFGFLLPRLKSFSFLKRKSF